uniref:Albumin domain-containing protein n=1 Tax=Hucho hucho TaxID=62062 RepID=A0A4W5LNQ7_9TELE
STNIANVNILSLFQKATFQHAIAKRVAELKALCIVHKTFGDRVVKAKKLIQYSQKMPQASFQEMGGMVDKIVATVAPCCSGDMVTCMKERVNYVFSQPLNLSPL